MPRCYDWDIRFSEFLSQSRNMRFRWGQNDCCLFAANGVLRITGVDYMADYRGAYDSKESAVALLRSLGGVTLSLRGALGDPIENKFFAKRGDVATVKTPQGLAVSLVCGSKLVALSEYDGLVFMPVSSAVKVWSI